MSVETHPRDPVEREPIERMREAVEALARIDRRTTTPGEHHSARWIAERLSDAGVRDVEIQDFEGPSTWAWANGVHAALGVVAALLGGRWGRALAVATLASYEADYTGRSQWMRRLLPRGTGKTVVARLPSEGPRARTIVFAAHHDAAHGGLVWHPRALAPYRVIARLTWKTPSYALPAYLALLQIATNRPKLRRRAALSLAGGIALAVQAARSQTAPGANDNATGVAALIELVRRFAASPVPGLELVAVFPGGEEVGVAGMGAWMRREGRHLDPKSTLVVGLDSLGGGEPVVLTRESLTATYRAEDLDWIDQAAYVAGVTRPRRAVLAVNTDAMLARHAGFPAVALLSMRDGWLGNFHTANDTPDGIDWRSVGDCFQLAVGVARVWAEAAA